MWGFFLNLPISVFTVIRKQFKKARNSRPEDGVGVRLKVSAATLSPTVLRNPQCRRSRVSSPLKNSLFILNALFGSCTLIFYILFNPTLNNFLRWKDFKEQLISNKNNKTLSNLFHLFSLLTFNLSYFLPFKLQLSQPCKVIKDRYSSAEI